MRIPVALPASSIIGLIISLYASAGYAGDTIKDEARAAVREGFAAVERSIIERYYGGGHESTASTTATTGSSDDRSAWRRLGDGVGSGKEGERDRDYASDERDDDGDRKQAKKNKHKKDKQARKGKGKSKKMPPGLAKRDTLPPGLAKRDTLPPGLAKRDLPGDLERKLPPVEQGLERVVVDGSVILVEKATGVVRDILRDVIRGKDADR